MTETIQDRLRIALEARGEKVFPPRCGKYLAMTCDVSGQYYFLGSSGALRIGQNATVSRSLTDTEFYKSLLAEADAMPKWRYKKGLGGIIL